jgi:hypothetical protein
VEIIIITTLTLIFTILIFLNSTTSLLKRKIPLKFGFKINDQIMNKIVVSSGDPAKRIVIRFENKESYALANFIFDIKFHEPLSVPDTKDALYIIEKHTSTESSDKYYKIAYFDIPIYPDSPCDIPTLINTNNKELGDYKITVSAVSINDKYKKKKKDLILTIK